MVTFHNRDPRPARPKDSFRNGRIDVDRISAVGVAVDVLAETAALAQTMRTAGALTFEPAR